MYEGFTMRFFTTLSMIDVSRPLNALATQNLPFLFYKKQRIYGFRKFLPIECSTCFVLSNTCLEEILFLCKVNSFTHPWERIR